MTPFTSAVPANVPFATSWFALLTVKLVIVKTLFRMPPDCVELIGTWSDWVAFGGAAVAVAATSEGKPLPRRALRARLRVPSSALLPASRGGHRSVC
jgi:hypothetical protein